MPFGLQPTHLILILVVALLVFGPSRLPEIGRSFGKMLKEFQTATKEATQGFSDEVSKPVPAQSAPTQPAPVQPAPVQPTAATVNCKNCGKPMQAGMKFCPECGAAQ